MQPCMLVTCSAAQESPLLCGPQSHRRKDWRGQHRNCSIRGEWAAKPGKTREHQLWCWWREEEQAHVIKNERVVACILYCWPCYQCVREEERLTLSMGKVFKLKARRRRQDLIFSFKNQDLNQMTQCFCDTNYSSNQRSQKTDGLSLCYKVTLGAPTDQSLWVWKSVLARQ